MMFNRSILHSGTLGSTVSAVVLGAALAPQAAAQASFSEPRFRFNLGAEIRYYGVDIGVMTEYGGMRYSDTVGVNSTDPGLDAYIGFPPVNNGNGRVFAGVWAAPGASVDVELCQSSGCSAIDTRFKMNPNDVSGFLGYEHVLWRATGMQVVGRGYAGGRISTWDLSVAGSYSHSDSGTEFVPAGGADVSFEWARPDCYFEDFWWGFYGGVQVQGGYDVTTQLSSATTHKVEVGEGVTGYFGVRGRFRF